MGFADASWTQSIQPNKVDAAMHLNRIFLVAVLGLAAHLSVGQAEARQRIYYSRPIYCGPGPMVKACPYLGILPPRMPNAKYDPSYDRQIRRRGCPPPGCPTVEYYDN